MNKKKEILLHIIFWIVFIAMDLFSDVIILEKKLPSFWYVLQTIAFNGLQAIIFYISYAYVCPKTIQRKRIALFILGNFLLIFVFAGVRYIAEEIILYKITGYHNYADSSRMAIYYVYDNSYYAIRILSLAVVFYFVKHTLNTNQRLSLLQLEKKQAELQVLKNQLSPHFLFNTLNSFYSDLFDTQPEVADDILKLSEMLRYVTYENENDMVPLTSEKDFLQNYIDLFNRRFDNNIPVTFTSSTTNLAGKIPSLLLIHFVENAFKHGILDNPNMPIQIKLEVLNNRLVYKVSNYYKTSAHYDEPGIGQKNIEKRLAILFPKNYTLEVNQTDTTYAILLNIPIL
ncbi:sensor histidine kinase [Neptunitalea lumnitzerae]|nr:sensor histidine kinase [Neptunitalea sp. Y10]